jgi:DNA polymerase IV
LHRANNQTVAAERAILHVDMDAFFASVEQLDRPELRGRPVLVGGDGPRGVVAAASYEARVYGCRSAQPTAVARRLCPGAVVVKPRGERYRELSARVREVLDSCTPLVEPLSIDEAFLDVTGSVRLLGEPERIARLIKDRIRAQTGLTASVGVAPNKLVAKIASDLDKPDGLVVIRADELPARLAPLPVSRLWGVGPRAEAQLARLGVRTFGDMQAVPLETLRASFGSHGESLWRRCRGIDERPVEPDHEAKSISHETTFAHDLDRPDAVRSVLLGLTEQVGARLRAKGLRGRTVTVKIRFGDFQTVTRSESLDEPTDQTPVLWRAAAALFDAWGFRPVRLIGVGVSRLSDGTGEQLGLFEPQAEARRRRADAAVDMINARLGTRALRRGGSL